ncbi:MAG: GDP-mannose 4,6-dehydratase [Bacteroidota bacterium]|nr:GDP-mannose 4,6-dehydratase [Bacteroidota bacterium]
MSTKAVLITGANGEIGHGLVTRLTEAHPEIRIVAIDVHPLGKELKHKCHEVISGDIMDATLIDRLAAFYDFETIYHLAAILSTKAEREPVLGHRVNVDGTLGLLELAARQARATGENVKFLFPSSIAAYGLPDIATKMKTGKVQENEWVDARTMYGINKKYCEDLGRYYNWYYRQIDPQPTTGHVDFRSIRFPGLISAVTLPTGGTSDYGPEMMHYAAQGKEYNCFVPESATLPFMVMPDAINALLQLEATPAKKLTQVVYNIGAFSVSAKDFYDVIKKAFPRAVVNFKPDSLRQKIVDSWPADVDDSLARKEWNWKPEYNFQRAFDEYLIPAVKQRYTK